MNVVVLQGKLSRPPEERTLPSGDRVVSYEITTRLPDGSAATAPVSWRGAPVTAGRFAAGEPVTVVGHVHRRFFRAGGATQSRTEVVAHVVLSQRQRARAARAVEQAIDDLSEAAATG